MDSKTLTAAQLQELVDFIKSRGFTEHLVVLEILDHFACKVEEILMQHPELSFQKARDKAHLSFGVMGFQPIAASFEEQIKAKYKSIYQGQLKMILSKPLALIGLPVTGVLYYNAYVWADKKELFCLGDSNSMSVIMVSLFAVLNLSLLITLGKNKRKHPYVRSAMGSERIGVFGVGFFIAMIDSTPHSTYLPFIAGFLTIVYSYLCISFLAMRSTIKKAVEDIESIDRMLQA